MKEPAFFDTNIFVYAEDQAYPEKQEIAIDLITAHQKLGLAMVSLQVLQEYFVTVTRKLGVDPKIAQQKVELMSRMHVVRLLPGDIIKAIEIHRLHGTSFWDSMIIHAAKMAGAKVLYSEDLHAGREFGDLRIANPFQP
jgi:predicted nucleic acid-binding protein